MPPKSWGRFVSYSHSRETDHFTPKTPNHPQDSVRPHRTKITQFANPKSLKSHTGPQAPTPCRRTPISSPYSQILHILYSNPNTQCAIGWGALDVQTNMIHIKTNTTNNCYRTVNDRERENRIRYHTNIGNSIHIEIHRQICYI